MSIPDAEPTGAVITSPTAPTAAARRGATPPPGPTTSPRCGRRRMLRLAVLAAALTVFGIGWVGVSPAAAAGPTPAAADVHAVGVLAVNDLPTIVSNLRNWIMGLLAGLATLFLTIGGVRYLMAGGDPSEVERAKGAFRSAAIGYVLAVIAPVVLTILKSIIGA